MVSESTANPAQAELPASLCEYLETRLASGALRQPEVDMEHLCHDPLWTQLNLYPDDVEALLAEHQAIVQFAEAIG